MIDAWHRRRRARLRTPVRARQAAWLKDIIPDVDVILASEEEAETTGRVPGTVLNAALTETRVMYDRAS